jgi:ABC-type nickel/cobalt efflux system permease component RcnA
VISLGAAGVIVLLCGLVGFVGLASDRYNTNTASFLIAMIFYIIVIGLYWWWCFHCLRTLQVLRRHTEELRLQLLTQPKAS